LRNTFREEFLLSFTRSRFTRQYELSGHRLDSVDSICDLGVFLDSKPNFTSHIDSLVVKASMMLGYIRRIGREFRDPYTLKTLYNSFVRSQALCRTRTTACIWKESRLSWRSFWDPRFLFFFCTLEWSRDVKLPPYCQRWRLTDLDVLSSRRDVGFHVLYLLVMF
jgi:hypothetical protein